MTKGQRFHSIGQQWSEIYPALKGAPTGALSLTGVCRGVEEVGTGARSSAGRAPGLHPGGRRFEPGRVHQDLMVAHDGSLGRLRVWVSHASNGGPGGRREQSEQVVPPESIQGL